MPQLDAEIVIVIASANSTIPQVKSRYEQSPVLRSSVYQANQVYFVNYHLWSRITEPIATDLIIEQLQQLFPS